MSPFRKRLTLYGLLAASVAGGVWLANADDSQAADLNESVSMPSSRVPRAKERLPPVAAPLQLNELSRMFVAADDVNPFGVKSWAPPVAPVMQPQVQAQVTADPVVPPLPFTFAGKLELEEGKWLVYLAKGDQSFGVSRGETFDGHYRLDGVADGNLVITYLPLGAKQLLPVGTEISE